MFELELHVEFVLRCFNGAKGLWQTQSHSPIMSNFHRISSVRQGITEDPTAVHGTLQAALPSIHHRCGDVGQTDWVEKFWKPTMCLPEG